MDGNGADETRVRYGTKYAWQTLPMELAEPLMIALREDKPKWWGDMLRKIINEDVEGGR